MVFTLGPSSGPESSEVTVAPESQYHNAFSTPKAAPAKIPSTADLYRTLRFLPDHGYRSLSVYFCLIDFCKKKKITKLCNSFAAHLEANQRMETGRTPTSSSAEMFLPNRGSLEQPTAVSIRLLALRAVQTDALHIDFIKTFQECWPYVIHEDYFYNCFIGHLMLEKTCQKLIHFFF